jgi:predicted O-methyltransferase YrrM
MKSIFQFIKAPDRFRIWVRQYKAWRLGPRAFNDHATHIPTLAALGVLLDVRSVLEFGSGMFSTITFLDRALFPNLASLHSYENDAAWYENVKAKTGRDNRLTLNYVEGPLHGLAGRLNLGAYDLIFIDDATTASLRAETIQQVVRHRGPRNVIVIHDFEVEAYQRAAAEMPKRFTMTAFNPNTGVLWEGDILSARRLRAANRLIRSGAPQVAPEDAKAWRETLLRLVK